MTKQKLVVRNKAIIAEAEAATMDAIPTPLAPPKAPKLTLPVSQGFIHLEPSAEVQLAMQGHYHGSPTLPADFRPTSHPDLCKCNAKYQESPSPLPVQCTLWLNTGLPVTGRKIYAWQCLNNNPECTIYYQGASDGIFNYSNATFISYMVLFDCLFGYVTEKGETFDGYIQQKHFLNKFSLGVRTNS